MSDGNGLAEALLGLDGFRILEVTETLDELIVTVETTVVIEGYRRCGRRAEAHDRRPVDIRDLACFGRPVRLRVVKRRWRCPESDCAARTWTESHPALYATGLVDTDAGILIDMVEGNTASDLRQWCLDQSAEWLADIETVSIDLTDSYRSGLSPPSRPCGSGGVPVSCGPGS